MLVRSYHRQVSSRGDAQIHDLTPELSSCIREAGLREGTATLFVPGSTAGFTTIEFEPGVVHDLQDLFERIAPRDLEYAHEQAWHDGNGHSHVRAGLLGPSLVVPVLEGAPVLGTWQQVVLVDFDVRPRERTWTVTLMGE
jgi:secondary thiamine-phosphate synthase enzyme